MYMEKFKLLRDNLQTGLKWENGTLDEAVVHRLNKDFGTKRIVWNDKDDLLLTSDKFRRRLISLSVLINTMKRKKDDVKELEYRRKFDMMNALAKIKEDDLLTEAQSIHTEAHGEEMDEDELDEYLAMLERKDGEYDITSLLHPYLKNNPYVNSYLKMMNPKYRQNIIF